MAKPGTKLIRAEEVIYLAGVTDGEGCFGYDSGSVRFTVTNTYRPMCERFQAAFGGQVRQLKGKNNEPGHRTQFSWRASGEEARAAMRELLPYLDEKAAQAIEDGAADYLKKPVTKTDVLAVVAKVLENS